MPIEQKGAWSLDDRDRAAIDALEAAVRREIGDAVSPSAIRWVICAALRAVKQQIDQHKEAHLPGIGLLRYGLQLSRFSRED